MQERMSPPPAAKTGAFGMDLPPSGPPRGAVPEGIVDGGGKFTGVSRRKQDQRKQEEEDKKKETSKYDDRAKDIEGILEIEEEGREDLTAVVSRPLYPLPVPLCISVCVREHHAKMIII